MRVSQGADERQARALVPEPGFEPGPDGIMSPVAYQTSGLVMRDEMVLPETWKPLTFAFST